MQTAVAACVDPSPWAPENTGWLTYMAYRLFRWLRDRRGKASSPSPEQQRVDPIKERILAIESSRMPLQGQQAELLGLRKQARGLDEALFIQAHADFVADTMANRNTEAATLERLHRREEAIELYEANLKDRFKGYFPYERLRFLYESTGRLRDAERVCLAFLKHGDAGKVKVAQFRKWLREHGHEG